MYYLSVTNSSKQIEILLLIENTVRNKINMYLVNILVCFSNQGREVAKFGHTKSQGLVGTSLFKLTLSIPSPPSKEVRCRFTSYTMFSLGNNYHFFASSLKLRLGTRRTAQLFIHSKTSGRARQQIESNPASKLVMLITNFRDEHRGGAQLRLGGGNIYHQLTLVRTCPPDCFCFDCEFWSVFYLVYEKKEMAEEIPTEVSVIIPSTALTEFGRVWKSL